MSFGLVKAKREAALASLAMVLDADSVSSTKAALSGLDVNLYPERRERIEVFLQGVESVDQLLRVEVDPCAALGASECRMLLKLSDGLRDFLATFRAGEGCADV